MHRSVHHISLLLLLALLPSLLMAQAPVPSTKAQGASIEERGKAPQRAVPEPEFLKKQNPIDEQGVYFGVGFRQIQMDLRDYGTLLFKDASNNGIAFNLGYLWKEKSFEYTRHVSPLKFSKTRQVGKKQVDLVETIHNNFSFFLSPRLKQRWYLHYGIGAQFSEISLISLNDSNQARTEESSTENSLVASIGVSYFVTHNFFIQYRLSYSGFTPGLTGSGVNNLVHSIQRHTLFLEYYFNL